MFEYLRSFYPAPAEVLSRTRPAGGGRFFSLPRLTPERRVVETREKRQMKTFNKVILRNTNNFA